VRRARRTTRTRRPLVALVGLLAALAVGYTVRALDSGSPVHPRPTASVALSSLPPQAATTVQLIQAGGPFPYPHNDGVVFHNDEGRLPHERDGYYREYTVPTPGLPDRGARRLITGGGRFWYTGDHYETFEVVDVDR
jgi:guanyl-specific ribonuclease Sa